MPDYAQRRERLRRLLRKSNADAMLVTSFTNVTYLTGFTGDDSFLLVGRNGGEHLLSDPRYTTQLEEECPDVNLVIRRPGTPILDAVSRTVRSAKIGTLAIEGACMVVEFHQRLADDLPGVTLATTSGLVEQLREIKDRDEIAEIRQAIYLAERAFAVVKASLRPEKTEKQIADELDHQIRLFGGQCCSFWPIVAVGPQAALPHARPESSQVHENGILLIDWGAKSNGLYLSDLTRVVVTSKVPRRLERIYEVVLNAQRRAIEAIRPGAIMEDIDATARKVIEDAGYGKRFGHSLGHGIGLEIHEQPRLAVDQKRPLKPGMVVTVEPGIYIPGWGGVRIEDDILVTKQGHEILSHCPKEFSDCTIH
jgi:Xaa-Pro aminopeptidase